MLGVLEIKEKIFFRKRFGAKYLRQVSYLLDACVHLTAVYPVQCVCLSESSTRYTSKYHYIIVTVVYQVLGHCCIIAVRVSWIGA